MIPVYARVGTIVLAPMILSPSAYADPPAEDDVVVTSESLPDPAATTTLGHAELRAGYRGQDVPYVLQAVPGVLAWGDTGIGLGYSYLSLRGYGQSRLAQTLDGVPLQDLEDMNVWFANYADFTSVLSEVQVQRGVGLSPGGAPSYAGALHFRSLDPQERPAAYALASYGSFGTARAAVEAHTGGVGPLRGVLRLAAGRTAGFRDHSEFGNLSGFAKVVRTGARGTWSGVSLVGAERSGFAYLAVDPDTLAVAPGTNPQDPREGDRFGQRLVYASWTGKPTETGYAAWSAYINQAGGSYDLVHPSDPDALRRFGLRQWTVGTLGRLVRYDATRRVELGTHLAHFHRRHEARDGRTSVYQNTGYKLDGNVWARAEFRPGRWVATANLQARIAHFRYRGEDEVPGATWPFLSPQIGLARQVGPLQLYGLTGFASREPARLDFFQGEDEPSAAYDPRDVLPERLFDQELGFRWAEANTTGSVNLFWMEGRNEIAATGEVNEYGAWLRKNVDPTRRFGVEVEGSWRPVASVKIRGAGALTRSRLSSWSQTLDLLNADGEWVGSEVATFSRTPVLLTPAGLGYLEAEVTPLPAWSFAAGLRGATPSHLDNTGDRAFRTPAWSNLTARSTGRLMHGERALLSVSVHTENLLNRKIWPSGYAWRYRIEGGSPTGTPYYYPAAPRSVFLTLELGR